MWAEIKRFRYLFIYFSKQKTQILFKKRSEAAAIKQLEKVAIRRSEANLETLALALKTQKLCHNISYQKLTASRS